MFDDQVMWGAIAGYELDWQEWDGEYLVYHDGSGDTHELNGFAATILKTLQKGPVRLGELTALVSDSLAMEPDSRFDQAIEQAVAEFDRLGLIERTHA